MNTMELQIQRHIRKAVPHTVKRIGYLIAAGFSLLGAVAHSQQPAWWTERGVLKQGTDVTASDYAAANQGQLKNLARAARDEMLAKKVIDYDHPIDRMVAKWEQPFTPSGDYAALNLGQLKAVAMKFHSRLAQVGQGATGIYPWTSSSQAAKDHAVANLGQLKNMFAFTVPDYTVDADGDFLPDLWEMAKFGSLDVISSRDDDDDSDGLSNYEEWLHGTHARSKDTDGDGVYDAEEIEHGNDPTNDQDAEKTPLIIRLQVLQRFAHYNSERPEATIWASSNREAGSDEISFSEAWDRTSYPGQVPFNGGTALLLSEYWPLSYENWVMLPFESTNATPSMHIVAGVSSYSDTIPSFPDDIDITVTSQLDCRIYLEANKVVEEEHSMHFLKVSASSLAGYPGHDPVNNDPLRVDEIEPVTFTIRPGQRKSEMKDYSASGGQHAIVGLLPVEFKEHESESGFDNFPRHADHYNKLERPWLMVPGDGDRPAKTDLYGAGTTKLKLEVKNGTQIITPQETGTSDPLEVTIQDGGQNDKAYVEVEKARMLDVASYNKRTLNVAVWAVTMKNDDQETNIKMENGKPNTVCVRAKKNILFTTKQGDDVADPIAKTITTGLDGICQTTADSHDEQLIRLNQGEPWATIIEPGQNGFLNTKPDGDDKISGQTLTTGEDGKRQTPKPTPQVAPQNVPSAEQLQAYLNKVYGNQMNVFFDVTLTPVEIAYDRVPGENDLTGGSTPAVPMHPPSMGVNNAFDFFYTDEPSGEEVAVFTTAFNPAKNINVYLFGTPINKFSRATGKLDALPLQGFQRSLGDYDTVAGYELCYVSAQSIDMEKVMWTVAHEIGHTGGLIHPRHGSRDNILRPGIPLATPELDERRTMYGIPFPSINSATGRMHSLFIKDECAAFRKEWKF